MDDDATAAARYFADPIGFLRELPVHGCGATPGGDGAGQIFAYGPELVETVLNARARFVRAGAVSGGTAVSAMQRVSYGMLAMNDEEHAMHRRAMLPFFHDRAQACVFGRTTLREVRVATREWAIGDRVDVTRAARAVSFRTTCSVILGIKDRATVTDLAALLEAWVAVALEPANRLADRKGGATDEAMRLAEELEAKLVEVMSDLPRESVPEPARWLLTAASEGRINRSALVGQWVTLLTAGWETTSAALTWTLLLLTHHPDVARRLTEELRSPREPIDSRLGTAALLDQVLRESLRLLSPALAVKRVARGPQQLGEIQIPAGSEVICAQYLRHRDPAVYGRPLEFNPGRWSTTKVRPMDFFPFGLGWRRCIGERFALVQLKTALTDLLQRFAFGVPALTRVDRRVRLSMAPADAVELDLLPAGGWQRRPAAGGDWRHLVSLPPASGPAAE